MRIPNPDKPTIVDLYCGAGGSSVGYSRAGFNVIGVDLYPMPRYPFEFYQYDAIRWLDTVIRYGVPKNIVAFHASPPCQRYSTACQCRPGLADTYPDLIAPTRMRFHEIGLPYIIENVPQAPLINPTILCGSQFNLVSTWHGDKVGLRRHRKIETIFPLPDPGQHDHSYRAVTVAGHAGPNDPYWRGAGYSDLAREVMGIDWMNGDELAEAVPPVYAEYIGQHLQIYLDTLKEIQQALEYARNSRGRNRQEVRLAA